MKILILYTEIAQYVTASLRFFLQQQKQAEIHLIKYPVNVEAPFEFENEQQLHFYNRKDFNKTTLASFVQELSPDAILCSGWIDKDYLAVCRLFYKKIPVVLVMDNHWKGIFKQRILSLVAPLTIHRTFNKTWVPGLPQKDYALQIGFKENQIKTGYYCGDTVLFGKFNQESKEAKSLGFPKRFICVARYIPAKGLENLWAAFAQLKEAGELKEWELWCLGTGEGFDNRIKHPSIQHIGFVQPADMGKYLKDCSFFILPSLFEPWAVVAHEFAAAGFPLLLSSAVGAASAFLEEGKNGYTFLPGNIDMLKEKLLQMAAMRQEQYNTMSAHSVYLSQKINPEGWSQTLLQLITQAPCAE